MGLLRRVLILLVVFGVLFAGLNVLAERVAEDRVASAIQSRFELAERPTVDLSVFPIVRSILNGTLPGLEVTARDVVVADLEFDSLYVAFEGISVSGGLLGGGGLTITVDRGLVEVEMSQRALRARVRAEGEDAEIFLREGEVRVVDTEPIFGRDRDIEAEGILVLDGRVLRFEADKILVDGAAPGPSARREAERLSSFEFKLPPLPGGFLATRVATRQKRLLIGAQLEDRTIEL